MADVGDGLGSSSSDFEYDILGRRERTKNAKNEQEIKQGDSSKHQFDSTISRDATTGHDKYPTLFADPEVRLLKDSDDEEKQVPATSLNLGTDKWNEHAKFAAEYIQKSKTKEGKTSMPQQVNDLPGTTRAGARTNGMNRVRSSYDRPVPEPSRTRVRVEADLSRQRYSPPSRIEEVDEGEDLDERVRRRPRSPSPLSRSPSPPRYVSSNRESQRARVADPVPLVERISTRHKPAVASTRRHQSEFSERLRYSPDIPEPYHPDIEYASRYEEPSPLRSSTRPPPYDHELEDGIQIIRPRQSTARRYEANDSRYDPEASRFDYQAPGYARNEAETRYSAGPPPLPRAPRYSDQETESVDDLESILTPELMEPSNRMPSRRRPTNKTSPYRILCQIECDVVQRRSVNEDRAHPALMFEDVPHWNPRFNKTSAHLTGFRPIYNLGQWLKSIDPLSFVVYRTYSCSWGSYKAPPPNGALNMPTVRVPDMEAKDFNESIEILSSELEEALLSVAKCTTETFTGLQHPNSRNENLRFESPYLFLYHHRAVLSDLSKKGDERLRREVFPLLIYLKERQRGAYKQADQLFAKKMVDTSTLKFLFCPNEVVVSKKNGIECAYVVRYLHFYPDDSMQLVCWSWTYDGTELKRKSEKLHVTFKAGDARSILDLSVYPLRFAPEDLKARLLARGSRMWEMRTPQLVTYKGMDFRQEKYINEGRCMLDYPTYKIMHRGADAFNQKKDQPPLDYDNFPETIAKDETLSEEAAMLCPPNIHGFLLKEKVWVDLLVDNVYGVTWNKDAFKRLVMPPTTKDLVEALIKAHASASWQQGGLVSGKRLDLIAGKGLGLIMLLHGSPGTGKTLTAESVAEIAEMPLYSVTCGDIGIDVDKVEQYLQKVLYLGKTWNCVLLLDEADVFLEERSLNDLKRNSLVSVFLRTLEYYEGILILTSNRVGTFDEAFRSRIQLALHYPKLTPLFRKKIWQNFFDILSEDREDVDLLELKEHMDELSKREMNGREIRNALTSARQLASYKNITLQWVHLKETLDIGKVFGDYLRDVHGHADEDWAREEQLR